MCCILQEVKLFLTIQYAIKYTDIGILKHFINPLIIYFFGVFQLNYSFKILFYQQNLLLVNTSKLQYIILSSRLINQLSRVTIYKAINLRLKYLNSSYKLKIKYYKNLTYNIDIIFNHIYLSNIQVRALYKRVEAIFSKYMPRTYTTATTLLDIFLLAYTLFTSDLAEPQNTK